MSQPVPSERLLDTAQDVIVVLDEEGTCQYANAAAEPVLGYDSDDLVGRDVFEFMHPEDREAVRETFEETVTADEERTTQALFRFRSADGSWIWLESRMSNDLVSEVGGYVVSSRDVTDRVEAERARERTQTHLQELAANAADVLWMFTGDWSELLFVNEAYEAVYGGSVSDLRADPSRFLDCIHPADRDEVQDAMACISDGNEVDMEYRVNPDTDFNRWVWVRGRPVVEDGDVVRVVGFSRDVTDRRRRERQLTVMDNLLRHNLRNDLNTVLLSARMIADDPGANPVEHAERIQRVCAD
ncbi:MAG: PAS domain-containing protein, partial [Halorientalis sp.]